MSRSTTLSRRTIVPGLGTTATLPLWAQSVPSSPDVIVVGTESAGHSAARTLIVEAVDRIGGQAWTVSDTFGVPFGHGSSRVMGPSDLPYFSMAKAWEFVPAEVPRLTVRG